MANKPRKDLRFYKGYGINYAKLRQKLYNEKKDYSVRELAAEIGIFYATISKIESETVIPTVEQVYMYKDFFNVSLDYLTGITVDKFDIEEKESFFRKMSAYTHLSVAQLEALHKLSDDKSDALYTIRIMIENADELFRKK